MYNERSASLEHRLMIQPTDFSSIVLAAGDEPFLILTFLALHMSVGWVCIYYDIERSHYNCSST
jgi:hypothetical protein